MSRNRLPLAMTMGDPAGVGIEVALKDDGDVVTVWTYCGGWALRY